MDKQLVQSNSKELLPIRIVASNKVDDKQSLTDLYNQFVNKYGIADNK